MGLVTTRPGAGTVVVGRIPKALSRLSGFTEDMRPAARPRRARARKVLECLIGRRRRRRRCSAPACRSAHPMLTLIRLRMAGGEALALRTRHGAGLEAVGADL